MKLIGKLTLYDRIIAYMLDPFAEINQLSQNEKDVLDRWQEAFTFQRNYKSTSDTAALLMKRFPGLSRAQAYRDCANSVSLFGDISSSSKQGIKHLSTEIVKDAIIIARLKNNEDGMIKGALAITTINGVNTNDPDLPNFLELEPHIYELGLEPGMVKNIQAMTKGGKIDLTQAVTNMANFATEAEVIKDE